MPVDEVVGLALRVARGLGKAHEKDIVHRDKDAHKLSVWFPEPDIFVASLL